jgi:hemerythrin superfamily protein
MTAATPTDIVDLLLEQHEDVRVQFIRVLGASGAEKLELFGALVEALQRHEQVEQEIVHPALIEFDPSATDVVEALIAEEREADQVMAELIAIGVADRAFDGMLAVFRTAVFAHAAHEEQQEFPRLRALVPADRRRAMASQVRAAQGGSWSH